MNEVKNMAQPEMKFKAGACTASVFANEVAGMGGKALRSVSLQRAYKDKAGQFQHTHSLKPSDLPNAILVLAKAYDYLISNQGAE